MMKAMNVFFALLLVASLIGNVWLWTVANKPAEVKVETHTDYVMIRDTMPTATDSHLTGDVITVTAAVRQHAKNHEPDALATELEPDTTATVWINGDSAMVILPAMQRVYADSLYVAYVSGFEPRLDSISIKVPHIYPIRFTVIIVHCCFMLYCRCGLLFHRSLFSRHFGFRCICGCYTLFFRQCQHNTIK